MANQRPGVPFQMTPAMMMAWQQRMRAMGMAMQPGGMRPQMGMQQGGTGGMQAQMGMQQGGTGGMQAQMGMQQAGTGGMQPPMGMRPQMGMQEEPYPVACGPQLVQMFPAKLNFSPPYGSKNHNVLTVNLTNVAQKTICYRVIMPDQLNRFYQIQPEAHSVQPQQTHVIHFEMKDNFTYAELRAGPCRHVFKVNALYWPTKNDKFDEVLWQQLQQLVGGEMQTLVIESELDHNANMLMCQALGISTSEQPTVQPPAMGMQPQVMGVQPSGMGVQPSGMGVQPSGMVVQPQAMGMQQGGMLMQQGFGQWPATQGGATETAPEEMDGGPMQSTGPELAFIQPTKLFFKPPFGQVSQKIKVKVECQALKGIAFKVRTHRLAHDFYSVKPSQGLIASGKIDTLVFEMCGGKDEKAILAADPKAHSFCVLVLRWPTENKTFDKDVFAKLQAKKGELQTITIDVALKQTPVSTPSTAGGAGGISVQPSKLQFHRPTGTSQFATLTLKNDGPVTVAWKTQGNRGAFYVVKPTKGLLAAAATEQIVFEMKPTCQPGAGHRFQVTAVPAPDNQHPPPEKWKNAKAQTISIDVEFI